ncbi:unnamed protein product [Oppiella nova]|uniref:Kelch domain-containing protein 10 n=1 Tax=Oppiella nova TaxID=334625 RepID=A0A7R9LL78_9ACAR|nr:unnamed protein product [Oppiella nova]CAG2164332.1 unnamed protein product [Oppiella nova]
MHAMIDTNMYSFQAFCFHKMQYKDGQTVPTARSGHRIVSTHSDVYSYGGYKPVMDEDSDEDSDEDMELESDDQWLATKPLFKELWRFSYVTRQWTRQPLRGVPPPELASHCATLLDNKYLLVFGGTSFPFGETSSNRLSVCNLTTNEWKCITNSDDNEAPIEMYGQALTIDRTSAHIYVCGGTTGHQYAIDVHRFDLQTHLWHCLYSRDINFFEDLFPESRYRHAIVLHKNKLYVIGGGTSFQCFSLSTIPVFDIDLRKWVSIETRSDLNAMIDEGDGYPKSRRCHDCIHIDDFVYLLGGTDNEMIFDDFWRLDLNVMQWTRLNARIPRALYFHSSSVSPTGRLSVFGGVVNTNHIERTNELFTAWLKIPTLKEMAFDAVLHYIHRNRNETKDNVKPIDEILFDLQIPANLRPEYSHRIPTQQPPQPTLNCTVSLTRLPA